MTKFSGRMLRRSAWRHGEEIATRTRRRRSSEVTEVTLTQCEKYHKVIKIIMTKIEWLGVIKMKSRLLNYYKRKNLKAKLRDNLHVKKMKSNSVWGTVILYVGIHCYMSEYIVECQNTLLHVYMSEYIGVIVVYIKEHMLLDVKSFISQDSTVFKLTAFCSKNLCKFINEDYFVLTSTAVYIMFGYTEYEIEYCLYGHKGW